MAVTLLAASLPSPQVVSSWLHVPDFFVTSSVPTGISSKSFNQGSKQWTAQCNNNGGLADAISQSGAGVIGIIHGLVISVPGSGLLLPISAGSALVNGWRGRNAATTVSVTDNTTNYIWYKQDDTFESRVATTPPSTQGTMIGVAIASGGNITSVDFSGVCYIESGDVIRFTADLSDPKDSPPSTWLGYTQTLGGLYLWDGTAYRKIGDDLIVTAKTANYTIVVADRSKLFTNEGAGGQVDFSLPSAIKGLGPFDFYVQAAQTLKVIANTGDTIRIAGNVSASAGNITNATVGGAVKLVCINNTEWVALSTLGTWSVT